jgi:predicted DNA-binding transcriptional regulator YafY
MKNKNAYARYRLIDQRLTNKSLQAPSLDDLVEYVSEKLDMSISVSSIQKDIYAMRYDSNLGFDAPIEFDRYARGYVYTEEDYSISQMPVSADDLKGLEFAITILEQFKDIPAIKVFEDAITKIASSVKQNINNEQGQQEVFILDRPNSYKGIEFMPLLVEAIRERREVVLKYKPFGKDEKKHTIHPFFIREYKARLYLIAKDIHPTKAPKTLTFSFDRMVDVIKMNKTFDEESVNNRAYFDATIGISKTDEKPQKVVLQFEPHQSNYLLSQPLHHSQEVIKQNGEEFTIAVTVVLNYELSERIKGYGAQVKVLQPERLANELKKDAEALLALYQ